MTTATHNMKNPYKHNLEQKKKQKYTKNNSVSEKFRSKHYIIFFNEVSLGHKTIKKNK